MFNQRVRRALDRTGDAACAQQPADERRLAGSKLALQRHDHPAMQRRSDARAARLRRGGIGKVNCQ
jgi:hypothetical protein